MTKRKPKTIYLEVIKREIYGFEEKMVNGWSVEQVIRHWFDEFNISTPHVSREGHHYGNIDSVVSVKVTTPEEFEPLLNAYFKKIEDAKKVEQDRIQAIDDDWYERIKKVKERW